MGRTSGLGDGKTNTSNMRLSSNAGLMSAHRRIRWNIINPVREGTVLRRQILTSEDGFRTEINKKI